MSKLILLGAILVLVGIFVAGQQNSSTTDTSSAFSQADKNSSDVAVVARENVDPPIEKSAISRSDSIDVSGEGLSSVPSSIFERTNAQALDLSDNNLTGSLPAEVRQLQQLQILDLSNNQFTGVPAEIGQLTKLEVLDLSHNQLTGLPYELGNLSNLKVLNLQGNSYAAADLEIIKQNLPAATVVKVD
ncbi:leucine-rich repeat domain-containing protein [Candidatus Pacebacteria bacterium]|nr:leucine-rich repeat domain-containing protein [Candidatus Paceibacterota bacterium]